MGIVESFKQLVCIRVLGFELMNVLCSQTVNDQPAEMENRVTQRKG